MLISACTSRYSVTTNLDNENFKNYFSPTKVIIYKDKQAMLAQSSSTNDVIKKKYHYLGAVEGEDCQTKTHHQAPDEVNARTNARRTAFELGANAIIFSGCALIEKNDSDKQCVATTVCYGQAYRVSASNDE